MDRLVTSVFGTSKWLQRNNNNQPRCSEIRRIEEELRRSRHTGRVDTTYLEVHPTYEDLRQCARNGCTGCRVLLQALRLNQITGRQALEIEEGTERNPVYVRLCHVPSSAALNSDVRSLLEVCIGLPKTCNKQASIACMSTSNIKFLRLPTRVDSVVPQMKYWLDDCCTNHQGVCGNLSMSSENPKRLIEVVSDNELRLIETADFKRKLKYVALSYCWGDGESTPDNERERIHGANTNSTNLALRKSSFPITHLPETMRDALRLIKALGLQYLWVDQVCILNKSEEDEGEDWNAEASKMHIIYGNAHFTLCACSAERATDRLFLPRKAWSNPTLPYALGNEWLVNFDMTLKEVRSRAPLFKRAWTLQEEHLSPRLLYYCGQRVYWSCSMKRHTELTSVEEGESIDTGRPFENGSQFDWMSDAQSFLNVRHSDDKAKLHEEWLDLVQAYCLRDMTHSTDRFRAISGLAAQYLSVYLTKDNKIWNQEYLAGLWKDTLAEDLAWCVEKAEDPGKALPDIAPTWSWASLPLCTGVSTKSKSSPTPNFEYLGHPKSSEEPEETKATPSTLPRDIVLQGCQKGAKIESIFVRGRLQKFMNSTSTQVDWSGIQIDNGRSGGYTFERYIDRHVYARNMQNGKIVSHEPNKREVEGQLDYLLPFDRDKAGSMNHLPDGLENELYCLKILKGTMLLLQYLGQFIRSDKDEMSGELLDGNSSIPIYRRVGISYNFRDGFFDGAEAVVLELR